MIIQTKHTHISSFCRKNCISHIIVDFAHLILYGLVVRLLQPRTHEHTVVIVTERAQKGSGGVGRVVCQSELCHQLPQEGIEAP